MFSMLSTIRPTQSYASIVLPVYVILAFITIIPETFGQTPKAGPSPVVVTAPSSAGVRSRSHTVSKERTNSKGPSLSEATEIERRVFELINEARRSRGFSPLRWDPDLCRMARAHSEDMAQRLFFSHQTPDGLRVSDRAHVFGITNFKSMAENIATNRGSDDPAGF